MDAEARTQVIKKASLVGIVVNAGIAAVKIGVGFASGSLALIADGFDSSTDVLTSVISFFAARLINRPPDADHPYGHGKAEPIAGKLISFIIFSVGFQIALTSVAQIKEGGQTVLSLPAVAVAGISIVCKLFLWIYKYILAKKSDSLLLMADAKNMRGDVVLSATVLTALLAGHFLNLPVLDSIAALAVSIWIMAVAFNLFREFSIELMDGHTEMKDYRSIIDAVSDIEGVANPHKIRIRKTGEMFYVDLDIEVDGRLTVAAGHRIAMEAEEAVRSSLENVADVMVHVEPKGNSETESFGISRETFDDREKE
ncbi:MAG: cation diffusion facilitator family transporter [Spirochaetia bacterium]|nr:cation diffusion facilitator family transporter [Spirochaetia bacterium]